MTRSQVVRIGLLSLFLLVFDGAAELPAAASAQLLSRAGDAFDAQRISSIVEQHNPALSPGELRRIGQAVMRNSEKYGIAPDLVTAVLIVESNARPWVRSQKGAIGLMQVMPHMFRPLEMAGNLTTIEGNIEAGCVILADNIRRLGEEDGISAYFWGSRIRGVAYLNRVRQARAELRRFAES